MVTLHHAEPLFDWIKRYKGGRIHSPSPIENGRVNSYLEAAQCEQTLLKIGLTKCEERIK